MIDLPHPLPVLTRLMLRSLIETALAPHFARTPHAGRSQRVQDWFGPSLQVAGGCTSAAGRPRLQIRLIAALLYITHTFNLSDEEVVRRCSENVVWQYFSGQEYYNPKLP